MKDHKPANEAVRTDGTVIDQRKGQIDPAGENRIDPNEKGPRSPVRDKPDGSDTGEDADDGK